MADPNKLGGLEEHFGGDEDKPTDNIHIRVIDTTVAKFDLVLREKLEEEGALAKRKYIGPAAKQIIQVGHQKKDLEI